MKPSNLSFATLGAALILTIFNVGCVVKSSTESSTQGGYCESGFMSAYNSVYNAKSKFKYAQAHVVSDSAVDGYRLDLVKQCDTLKTNHAGTSCSAYDLNQGRRTFTASEFDADCRLAGQPLPTKTATAETPLTIAPAPETRPVLNSDEKGPGQIINQPAYVREAEFQPRLASDLGLSVAMLGERSESAFLTFTTLESRKNIQNGFLINNDAVKRTNGAVCRTIANENSYIQTHQFTLYSIDDVRTKRVDNGNDGPGSPDTMLLRFRLKAVAGSYESPGVVIECRNFNDSEIDRKSLQIAFGDVLKFQATGNR